MGGLGQKEFFMKNFIYANRRDIMPAKNDIIKIIHNVQNDLREKLTFSYEFIGSASRNMITYDPTTNVGFDFDVNIKVNFDKCDRDYSAKQLRNLFSNSFNKFVKDYGYDNCEDSKRVLTIKVKDKKHSKILHSCDFAIVNDYERDGVWYQQFIYFNKNQNSYEWQNQPEPFYMLSEKEKWCKERGLWQEVRELYLKKKNKEKSQTKKSRSIYAETIANICNNNGYYD